MKRREFVKLVTLAMVAPALPEVASATQPRQYGDYVTFIDPPTHEEIKHVVNGRFIEQIRTLKLNYPWSKKNFSIVFKSLDSRGTIDPLGQRLRLGWKYWDKP